MSGTPLELEIQTQWRNATKIVEDLRAHVDGQLGAGNNFDTLIQSLEGEYLPAALTSMAQGVRAGMSSLIGPANARQILEAVLYEYAKILDAQTSGAGFGAGYTSPEELFRAFYEYLVSSAQYVTTRGITYDTTPTTSGTGTGTVYRLTEDENGFDLEACHVERKQFRVRADATSGTEKWAETLEMVGGSSNYDNTLRGNFGSGQSSRALLVARHAGTGQGGSLLRNSSFSQYNASSTPKFTGWDVSVGSDSNVSQDTTNFYRSHHGAATDGSVQLTGGANITIRQTLANMRTRRLDPRTPYFCRIMYNRSVGSATGRVVLNMGASSASVTLAAETGWNELKIPLTQACWLKNFNEEDLEISIQWDTTPTGTLLIDDVIFSPFDLVDGTYWLPTVASAPPTPWRTDDVVEFVDTGGAPGTGKLQYYCWLSGLGYLPNSGTTLITDPA